MKPLWNEAFLSDSLLLSWACLGLTENVKAFEHLCTESDQLCEDASVSMLTIKSLITTFLDDNSLSSDSDLVGDEGDEDDDDVDNKRNGENGDNKRNGDNGDNKRNGETARKLVKQLSTLHSPGKKIFKWFQEQYKSKAYDATNMIKSMDKNNHGTNATETINFKNGEERTNLLLVVQGLCSLCDKESGPLYKFWAEVTPLVEELNILVSNAVKSDGTATWKLVEECSNQLVRALAESDNPVENDDDIYNKSREYKSYYMDDYMKALLKRRKLTSSKLKANVLPETPEPRSKRMRRSHDLPRSASRTASRTPVGEVPPKTTTIYSDMFGESNVKRPKWRTTVLWWKNSSVRINLLQPNLQQYFPGVVVSDLVSKVVDGTLAPPREEFRKEDLSERKFRCFNVKTAVKFFLRYMSSVSAFKSESDKSNIALDYDDGMVNLILDPVLNGLTQVSSDPDAESYVESYAASLSRHIFERMKNSVDRLSNNGEPNSQEKWNPWKPFMPAADKRVPNLQSTILDYNDGFFLLSLLVQPENSAWYLLFSVFHPRSGFMYVFPKRPPKGDPIVPALGVVWSKSFVHPNEFVEEKSPYQYFHDRLLNIVPGRKPTDPVTLVDAYYFPDPE